MARPRTRHAVLMAAAPLAGLAADLLAIAYEAGEGDLGACDVSSFLSCSAVIGSRYSTVMGVSLSTLALAYFSAALALAVLYTATGRAWISRIYLGLSVMGLPVVAALVYVELGIIGALCIYCTVMHASIVAMAAAAAAALRAS